MKRQIAGLKEVSYTLNEPFKVQLKKTRGSIKKGHEFERRCRKFLTDQGFSKGFLVLSSIWIAFEDSNGKGHCLPDLLIRSAGKLFVCECKLTFKPQTAKKELDTLYLPLLKQLEPDLELIPIQFFKNKPKLAERSKQWSFASRFDPSLTRAYTAIWLP